MAQIMDKAESHAAKNNIALDTYLQARLYPDMYNLLQQVQYVCYVSVDLARHFSDAPAPRVGYDETTWPELRKSVDTAELDEINAGFGPAGGSFDDIGAELGGDDEDRR